LISIFAEKDLDGLTARIMAWCGNVAPRSQTQTSNSATGFAVLRPGEVFFQPSLVGRAQFIRGSEPFQILG